ncbi:MAG: taurine catabolism dioxygenase TauD [Rhodospirillaceae bacterium]|nr:taurine catabolism dioxygenase TauD [Rhodospirillaceae bacterium]|tara:strand:+ start:29988 stop:30842 length:855 start_codon:yes stop_codon:yes gene_type:complete
MTIKIEPISDAVGVSITGIDLGTELDEASYQAVHRAWLDHHVLVFPGQDLAEEDQVRFTGWFGEVGQRIRKIDSPEGSRVSHPGTMLISNIREDGKPIGSLPDGEMMYHSDGAFAKQPYRYTLLYALEVPSVGGNTLFANLHKAYDELPAALKNKLQGCHGEHIYYANNGMTGPKKSLSGIRQHPIFIAHEETGRTAIYANRLMTHKIVELPEDESDDVLAQLLDHIEKPEFIYDHKWTPGDFVIWDNRCLNHARSDFSAGERRLLRRTTVVGVDPLPAQAEAA